VRNLLVQTQAQHISNVWSEYEDKFLQGLMHHTASQGGYTYIYQYELVDTLTGASQLLIDAPIGTFGSEMAWSPDSESVVVSDVYLPLSVDNPAERSGEKDAYFLSRI